MNLSLLQGVCEVESHNILYHSMSDNKMPVATAH